MSATITADICIIGAGSAGLSVAAGAAQMGARTVLIEVHIRDGVMGGDCLHTGCVPSKALLAAGKRAHQMGTAARFGIANQSAEVDFAAVNDHVKDVIGAIAPIDSVDRFEGLGVTVIEGRARFTGPRELEVNGQRVRAKWFVIATGSTAAVPPIPGIETVPYLTNETIFDNRTLPEHLIIIGGGPIGMEMAQAHRRLGARVTVLEGAKALSKDDPELTAVVTDHLRAEGVDLREETKVISVAREGENAVAVEIETASGQRERLTGSHLLVAAGRKPSVDGLDLEAAGVAYSRRGVEVNERLRTANRRIYAIGDVAGGLQFTHVAGYHASIVVRNTLLRLPTKADTSVSPWVTYTDPELAHVGLTEEAARARFGRAVTVIRSAFAENDRAQAERETAGFAKVVVGKSGRVLGASIVGAHAGELIYPFVLAVTQKMKLTAFTGMIAPYPTLGEVAKRAASAYYTPFVFGAVMKSAVALLKRLPN